MGLTINKWALCLLVPLLLFASGFYLKPRPYLTVAGPIKMADGIGRQSVELIATFYDDFTINCFATNRPNMTDVPLKIQKLIGTNLTKRELGKVLFYEETLLLKQRYSNKCIKKLQAKVDNQIRIAYSMCESSRIPEVVVDRLNYSFDAVALPDPFLVDVYRKSGVTIPLFTLPLGLDLTPFLEQPLKESVHNPFSFINLSACEPRKNLEALIVAFHQAFGNDPNVVLRINCRRQDGDAFEKIAALIDRLQCTNVQLTVKTLSKEEYLAFMNQGDVLITLSKGEGFSIQPREAMALGMAVILSDNTAHLTILQSQLALGVSCPEEEPYIHASFGIPAGTQFLVNIDEAATLMRSLYETSSEWLKQAGARREWAKQYQFSNVKELYRNMIKPKKLLFGDLDEVTEEYLMTRSSSLYEKYKKLTQ